MAGDPSNEGTVNGTGTYTNGSNVPVSASAATGWQISNITVTPASGSPEEIQKIFVLEQLSAGAGPITTISGGVLADQNKTVTFTFASLTPVPIITSATNISAQVGTSFTYQIAASNTPVSFGASGLPAGLSVNTSSGLISGMPIQAGTFAVSLSATNAGGTGTAALTLSVAPAPAIPPVITSVLAANVQEGQSFTYQITASNSPTSFDASGLPNAIHHR